RKLNMPFCSRLPLVILGICILSRAPLAANEALPPTPVQPRESNSKDATAILLRYHFQQGECSRYRLKLEGKGTLTTGNDRLVLPLTLLLEYSVTQTVTAVHPDGAAELKLGYSCQKEVLNGGSPAVLPLPRSRSPWSWRPMGRQPYRKQRRHRRQPYCRGSIRRC
ncbi:MAG TPA: hypothetical protein VHR86_07340, partial [Armatimonadota bacterium]|nr:hypothetical protein [Armatimonadota bacterium]